MQRLVACVVGLVVLCGSVCWAADAPAAAAEGGSVVVPGVTVYWGRPLWVPPVYVAPPVVVSPPPVVVSPGKEVSVDVVKRKWGVLGLRGYRARHIEIR